ncbi:lysozyme inhibitor LprI family protein [Roseateles violae]|uniref:Lysozyme inhibitor LprI family protein n=1 Tax=Roseateles violae TaxID=3058042 RepID=A0ABT8DN07_9BURK|nr:lysozyme inhibitor LprI family protein [Pelomonas sp. PFR6]MDN3919323.1 lysozyme inhibitor LprI family protein [Pelomonas sp. PFR6]
MRKPLSRTPRTPGWIAALLLAPLGAAALDCARLAAATEPTLRLICAEPELRAADDLLNQLYRAALAKAGPAAPLRAEQLSWIRSAQAPCRDAACLREAYAQRIAALRRALSPWCATQRGAIVGDWARAGEAGFFEEFSAGPQGEFDSWQQQRPQISGGRWIWRPDCGITIASEVGLGVEWILIDAKKNAEFSVLEPGVPGVARYRLLKAP